jgi:GDP-L-fucose synthase
MGAKYWAGKRVLVTGGNGFLGSFVVKTLRRRGCKFLDLPHRCEFDLRVPQEVQQLFDTARPDVVIHLAAVVGGIGANSKHPGQFFYDNAMMGLNLIERARSSGIQKFVCLGTVCSYPKFTPAPFMEDSFWDGYPEETNAPYGLAKKMLLVQLQSYRAEYGFPGIYLVPVNLYGPKDNFDLESSHVIPALIHKCVTARDAGESKVVVWGTGKATREFLYVEDAAEAIVLAAEEYDKPAPVNLGSGNELSIWDLVYQIKDLVGFSGSIEWDDTKPDGQPRRFLDTTRARKEFGWTSRTTFREGLRRTVAWFIENRQPPVQTEMIPLRGRVASAH